MLSLRGLTRSLKHYENAVWTLQLPLGSTRSLDRGQMWETPHRNRPPKNQNKINLFYMRKYVGAQIKVQIKVLLCAEINVRPYKSAHKSTNKSGERWKPYCVVIIWDLDYCVNDVHWMFIAYTRFYSMLSCCILK